eukprot:2625935-Amphidinium_carterae.1
MGLYRVEHDDDKYGGLKVRMAGNPRPLEPQAWACWMELEVPELMPVLRHKLGNTDFEVKKEEHVDLSHRDIPPNARLSTQ